MFSKSLFLTVACALTSINAVSCRSVELTRAGALSNYDRLERDTNERARESFIDRSFDWSAIDGVVLEPLQLELQPSSLDTCTPKQLGMMRDHYDAYLREAIGPNVEYLTSPRPGSVLVRSAMTEIDTCNKPLNWITGILVLWPVDVGGATLEVELLDSDSNRQLAAIVNADKATLWNALQGMTSVGHACQALEETAGWVGSTIQ